MWCVREAERAFVGEVRAVDGDYLTLAIVGIPKDAPMDAKSLPSTEESDQLVRVSTKVLISDWKRVSGPQLRFGQGLRRLR
jgi:hypothetical protein